MIPLSVNSPSSAAFQLLSFVSQAALLRQNDFEGLIASRKRLLLTKIEAVMGKAIVMSNEAIPLNKQMYRWGYYLGTGVMTFEELFEAAVFFPFAFLRSEIEIKSDELQEFDEAYCYYYRGMVWSAFEEYILPNWQALAEEYGEDEDEQVLNLHLSL